MTKKERIKLLEEEVEGLQRVVSTLRERIFELELKNTKPSPSPYINPNIPQWPYDLIYTISS